MKTAEEILKSSDKFYINLGLKRIKLILALLYNPQKEYKIIHVAGTNGKGSTCKIINQILIEHFKNTSTKVGLYTSPHLFSYCERIKINNIDIKEDVFNRLVNDINDLAIKNNIHLTEFELLTAVALHYFYINKVDYVILETGLGGRYDATNVVKSDIQVITNIDFDHMDRLGNTINRIAFEKAGIIKENSKVIINKNNLGYEVVEKVASQKNAKLIFPPDIEVENNAVTYENQKYKFNLNGIHQKENLSLALGAVLNLDLKITAKDIKEALNNVSWKYRLEYNQEKNLLIDGCHNPSGVRTFVDYLNSEYGSEKKDIIFGCLKTKDYTSMFDILFEIKNVDNFYFLEFNYPSSLKYEEIDCLYKNKFKKTDFKELETIVKNKKLKTLCGSLYMLGELGKKDII